MRKRLNNSVDAGMVPRFIFGVFGFVFAGIGISTIIVVWSQPWHEFGAPPLIFRVSASFISIAFIAFGAVTLFGAIWGRSGLGPSLNSPVSPSQITVTVNPPARSPAAESSVGYTCPRCGATLGDKSDVSPLGDVKCTFCKQWFNIHRS